MWGKITLAAALVVASGGTAAPAQANVAYAYTLVTWSGTSCIAHQGASMGNPWMLGSNMTCDMYGWPVRSAEWSERRSSGQWIGIDPLMGNADWIGCTITVDGLSYSDFASADDGTDVSCLRVVF